MSDPISISPGPDAVESDLTSRGREGLGGIGSAISHPTATMGTAGGAAALDIPLGLAPRGWANAIDDTLETAGEWFNPILVKECRQALKSRQFLITFLLMLGACWIWSFFSATWIRSGQQQQTPGDFVFQGYSAILSFPLLIIVPFMAFRSLATETEDKTFELLSVTNLTPRQIVGGKFASAVVQMLLYFSAVVPCLTFTYMLRGIDFPTIGFVLLYLVLASLLFTTAALMLATVTKERFWQTLVMVGLIIGLFLAFYGCQPLMYELIQSQVFSRGLETPLYWIVQVGLILAITTTGYLFYLAGASQITFPSDNRATALRVWTVIQHALFFGWACALLQLIINDNSPGEAQLIMRLLFLVSAAYWYIMGVFATGESDLLSPRVKRELPRSELAKVFFSWLYPGPGRGYLYALANYIAVAAMFVFLEYYWFSSLQTSNLNNYYQSWRLNFSMTRVALMIGGYLMLYLGLGAIFLRYAQRSYVGSFFLRILVHVLMILCGIGWPMIYLVFLDRPVVSADSLIYWTNPFWMIILEYSNSANRIYDRESPVVFVLVAGGACLLANLPGIMAEMRQERLMVPTRVALDQAEQARAQLHRPASPWDSSEP
ncbi:MAG: ABC-2 transporter permease [Pirellulales bacterium]|nr:ABC-2 transporter permease [Pirellulales bacterium]